MTAAFNFPPPAWDKHLGGREILPETEARGCIALDAGPGLIVGACPDDLWPKRGEPLCQRRPRAGVFLGGAEMEPLPLFSASGGPRA